MIPAPLRSYGPTEKVYIPTLPMKRPSILTFRKIIADLYGGFEIKHLILLELKMRVGDRTRIAGGTHVIRSTGKEDRIGNDPLYIHHFVPIECIAGFVQPYPAGGVYHIHTGKMEDMSDQVPSG
jgi:hypothetical protein